MKPKCVEVTGGYLFDFDDENINILVSRLHLHNDGRLTGEILVSELKDNKKVGLLPPSQINFISDRTRKSHANTLKSKRPDFAWEEMIDQVSYEVQFRARQGEAVQELFAGSETAPPKYILKPFIISNYPTIIFGERSSAKSTLALIFSQQIMLPWKDNPLGLDVPDKSVRCLYLDWETDSDTINWQLSRLDKGMDMGGGFINYRRCAQPLAQDIEQIMNHISATESEVIIIDSLGVACGGDLNKSEAPLAFFAALRQLKTTSVILAHTSKDRENKHKSVFGSAYFENMARNIFEIQKRQDFDENEMDIVLFNRKPPPFAGMHKPIGFKLIFTEDTMSISVHDPKNVSEFVARMSTANRIMIVLRNKPFTPKELSEELEVTNDNVRNALLRLKNKNLVVKVGEKYGLTTQYEFEP